MMEAKLQLPEITDVCGLSYGSAILEMITLNPSRNLCPFGEMYVSNEIDAFNFSFQDTVLIMTNHLKMINNSIK